ncbi:unnamed protein product [Ophioblennius macclurei]
MSVRMSRADGVTMLTMTSDPDSVCPPLCQILKGLCCSPLCCTVSRHMRRIQTGSQSVLGTLQIMIGMFNIGLGAILSCSGPSSFELNETGYPYWMGGFFVCFGILCILMEKYPSPCLVLFHTMMQLAGVGFAIAAIVLYCINIVEIRMGWMCREDYYWYHRHTTPSPEPDVTKMLKERCYEARDLSVALLRSINAMLILLSVLELCVVLSAFTLGVKSMRSREEKKKQTTADPEQYRPLLEDDATQPSA